MASVTFYNNNKYGGISDSFSGAQRRTYGTSQAWDSIQVGSGTWLVVYDGSNFTGNYLKVTSSQSDLNHVDRGDDGDWKNQIKSFILYASQPSWWNNSGTQASDLNLASTQVMVTSDTDFTDDCSVYNAAVAHSDLSDTDYVTDTDRDMNDNIQSIATGSSCWVEVWSDSNYGGSSLRVYPNTKLSDLNSVDRIPDGDWKNQISSLKAWSSLPDATWNLQFDQSKFFSLFPGAVAYSDTSGPYYRYVTQDAAYDIRVTDITSPTSTTYQVSFRIDYELTGSNDKVLLDVVVNADNTFNSISYTYEQGSAIQIPQSWIKAVDVGVEVLGLVGALETAGVSEEAADSFIEAFDTACKVFNKVMGGLYKLSEANDGRFYLVAVCSHVVCRALNSISTID